MPHVDSFDGLIVMGGPMSVNDTVEFPWLVAEIELIRSSIQAGKKILGICLGAQLIARALESTVYRNRQKEIGWFPVAFTTSAKKLIPSTASDDRVTVFHWHGETFDLPPEAMAIGSSSATENQGLLFGDHVLGLQFHLEMTKDQLSAIIDNCRSELKPGAVIQPEDKLLSGFTEYGDRNKAILFEVLDNFFG